MVPDAWVAEDLLDPGPTMVAFAGQLAGQRFDIAAEDVAPETTLETFAVETFDRTRGYLSNVRVIADGIQAFHFAGESARAFVLDGRYPGEEMRVYQIVTIK